MRNNRSRTYAECVLAMTDKIKLLKNPEYAIPKPLVLGRIGYCLLRKYMKVWKLDLQGFANSLGRIECVIEVLLHIGSFHKLHDQISSISLLSSYK